MAHLPLISSFGFTYFHLLTIIIEDSQEREKMHMCDQLLLRTMAEYKSTKRETGWKMRELEKDFFSKR